VAHAASQSGVDAIQTSQSETMVVTLSSRRASIVSDPRRRARPGRAFGRSTRTEGPARCCAARTALLPPIVRSIAAAGRARRLEPLQRLGPTLGVVLHYGPDYRSASSGDGRGPSFFAMGPKVGAFVGLDWPRRSGAFGVQLGVSPHFAPLLSISDDEDHRGVVVGGSLDVGVYF